jgi:hypothetical protein
MAKQLFCVLLPESLVCPLQSDCGILLTTYETMRLQRAELVGVEWGYVVLDEGHKIRWAYGHVAGLQEFGEDGLRRNWGSGSVAGGDV